MHTLGEPIHNLAKVTDWYIDNANRRITERIYQVDAPSLRRMAQLKFGESEYGHHTDDKQANSMLNPMFWNDYYTPARVFLMVIRLKMLFDYIVTGAVDVKYNTLVLMDQMYWDDINKDVPNSLRPNKLLAEHSEVVFEYACVLPRSATIMPDVDDLGGHLVEAW